MDSALFNVGQLLGALYVAAFLFGIPFGLWWAFRVLHHLNRIARASEWHAGEIHKQLMREHPSAPGHSPTSSQPISNSMFGRT